MDPAVDIALRAGLGLLLAFAAWHKLRDMARFRATLADYRLLPERLVAIAAVIVVGLELLTAMALLDLRIAGAWAAAALLTLYAAAIGVNLARGRRHIDCGCGGPTERRTISGWLVARNAVLVAVALAGLAPVASRPMTWVDAITIPGMTLLLAAVYAAVDGLIANAPGFARLRGAA